MNAARPLVSLQVVSVISALFGFSLTGGALAVPFSGNIPEKAIPLGELGIEIEKQYSGDGVSVVSTNSGAIVRAVMQDLEGEINDEGLWLTSRAGEDVGSENRFRVKAVTLGRSDGGSVNLPLLGSVRVADQTAIFGRLGLVEEYSASTDGIRQDFVVLEPPQGSGRLTLGLEVLGARVDQTGYGAELTLESNGRAFAYHRLHVTDATGRVLVSNMSFGRDGGFAIEVDDDLAVYPVRIDPTFSDADWVSTGDFDGANGNVNVMTTDVAGNLYVAGEFTAIVNIVANRIAKWDGNLWTAFGEGVNGKVNALAVSDGNVYAGGEFTEAGGVGVNRIAMWDGNAWTGLGTGIEGSGAVVRGLEVAGADVYACGTFATAGGVSANNIARWDGAGWNPLGSGTDIGILTIKALGSHLYAGGGFSTAGGVSAPYIARWNGVEWEAVGSGVDGRVYAFAASDSDLYVGGQFLNAGGSASKYIAQWDGSGWNALGGSSPQPIYSVAVSGSTVYAGNSIGIVYQRTGSSWTSLYSGFAGKISALAVVGSTLCAGGEFSLSSSSLNVSKLAKWNGTSWGSFGNGLSASVSAVVVSGSDIYIGGYFKYLKGIYANSVAKWDGSEWSGLGAGVTTNNPSPQTGSVSTLTMSGSDLYVGGSFNTAGGEWGFPAVAKWNGTSWERCGGVTLGNYERVHAIEVIGSDVFIGGTFTKVGSVTVNGLAKWDGSTTGPVGNGLEYSSPFFSPSVYALEAIGNDLYVGGRFTSADGIPTGNIAKWSNGTWSSVGAGTNSTVYELRAKGTNLYAGGSFTTAGGTSAKGIARWDGAAWNPIGGGIASGSIKAIAFIGSDVYVGGQFSSIGGVSAQNIAKWNGTVWSALGTGVLFANSQGGEVGALATSGNMMYVGGSFIGVGGKVSPNFGKAVNLDAPSVEVRGNGVVIANGDATPSDTDNTDFGVLPAAQGASVRSFTIGNTGSMALSLGEITLGGVHAADFTVSVEPDSIVLPGESSSFSIRFDPYNVGVRSATVSFSSDDVVNSPFEFQVQGVGENNAPTDIALTPSVIAENNPVGATVGVLAAVDLDVGDFHSFSLVSGEGSTHNALFSISGSALRLNVMANYEATNSYAIRVRATDRFGSLVERALAVQVANLNEAPTNLILYSSTIAENLPGGTTVGNFGPVDQDANETHAFSLVSGAGDEDNESFAISDSTLRIIGSADYEAKKSYSIRVRCTDSGGLHFEKAMTISVVNVNEAPTEVTLSSSSIPENSPAYAIVGVLLVADPDNGGTHSVQLVPGDGDGDNDGFVLSGAFLRLKVGADYERKSSYNIRVRVMDGGALTVEQALIVSVVNVNEPPSFAQGADQVCPIRTNTMQTVGNWATSIDDGDSTVSQVLTFNVQVVSGEGLFSVPPSISSDGTLTYTPGGTSGVANISVSLSDDDSINGSPARTSVTRTFTILVEDEGSLDPLDAEIEGGSVLTSVCQPDGKIILAGSFNSVQGVGRNNIARLNADGTLDLSFDPNANGSIHGMALQSDGRLILCGSFSTLGPNGAAVPSIRNGLARINGDGTLDDGFDPNPNDYVRCVVIQGDGKILLGGDFTSVQLNAAGSAVLRNRIARLHLDGTLDLAFDPNANDVVYGMCVQPDGSVVVYGDFTSLQPNGASLPTNQRRIARVNADGSLNGGFDPRPNGTVYTVARQSDGRLLLGGAFTSLQTNGAPVPAGRKHIARIESDGSLDAEFDPTTNAAVFALAVQADQRVLIGGAFSELQPEGDAVPTVRNCIARLEPGGAVDVRFDPNANDVVYSLGLLPDGRVMLGGVFTALQPNGALATTQRSRFALLANALAAQSISIDDSSSLRWLRSGAGPEVDAVSIEIRPSGGTSWSLLGHAARIGSSPDWELLGLSLTGDGDLRARGRTSGGIYGSSSGLVTQEASFHINTPKEAWRESFFGMIEDVGDAADMFDYDRDGILNLLEWACGLDPTRPDVMPGSLVQSDAVIEFYYNRSVAALNSGAKYTVEWTDSLAADDWSDVGVVEHIVGDDGVMQEVKATVPRGGSTARFVHLSVMSN